MSPRDLVYVGHMLDMARKAVSKTQSTSRADYDADENLRLALIYLINSRERKLMGAKRNVGLGRSQLLASGLRAFGPHWQRVAAVRYQAHQQVWLRTLSSHSGDPAMLAEPWWLLGGLGLNVASHARHQSVRFLS